MSFTSLLVGNFQLRSTRALKYALSSNTHTYHFILPGHQLSLLLHIDNCSQLTIQVNKYKKLGKFHKNNQLHPKADQIYIISRRDAKVHYFPLFFNIRKRKEENKQSKTSDPTTLSARQTRFNCKTIC